MSGSQEDDDLLACSISLRETHVMGVEGAPGGSRLLYYPVAIRRQATQALLDSGASVNCIDADLADKAGGVITHKARGVLLYPDKRHADVKGITQLEVRAKGYREKVTFWVVKGLGIPMLLGEPWLRSWNPTINWQTKEMTFSDGVVWKAVGESDKQGHAGKNRRWRPFGERRTIHLILGKEEGSDEERDEEKGDAEIPHWLSDMVDVFQEPLGVRRDGRLEHKIRLRDGAKLYQKAPYRLSPEQVQVLHAELKEFKDRGWIQPSKSEWATVAVVVPKKDQIWRICIDYRDLNAISEMDAYPLPRIEDLFTKLSRAQWFTKMDLKAGFHQIPMCEDSIKYTSFRIGVPMDGCSHYEWTVMPMGLSTAPASFQRWMERSLEGLEEITLVYLNDVLVFSQEEQQHKTDVRRVF